MTLPTRVLAQAPDAQEHAVRLIVFTRHRFPEMASSVAAEIRRHGREYIFKILGALATPITMYYREIGGQPLSPHGFEPGSAEHFAYGYVGAVLDGSQEWSESYMTHFRGSCESEIERAMLLLANTASQCLNLLAQIQEFDSAISAL